MLQLSRGQQLIILIFLGALLFGAGFKYAQVKSREVKQLDPVLQEEESFSQGIQDGQIKKIRQILVHVTGAVEKPGVYKLFPGSRVTDAVDQAKATPEADLQAINLAAPLTDGQKVIVPPKISQGSGLQAGGGQRESIFVAPGGEAGSTSSPSQLININAANEQELDSLPGIGPSLAKRIIQYRETNGFFSTVEDIKKVSGIGDKKFEGLKDLISVY